MDKELFETLQLIRNSKGICKLSGQSNQDYEAFENLTIRVRQLARMGLVTFDESKGKALRNSRNNKSQYVVFQCRLEYPAEKILSFDSYEAYRKSKNNIEDINSKVPKIFISHSEADAIIAEKMVEYLMSALVVENHEIRCSSVPGHKLKFGSISAIIKEDISNNPVIIVLITPKSLSSKWVMFELGASWVGDLTIIPIVSANLTYKAIPGPLGEHSAIELCRHDSGSRLSDLIAQISDDKLFRVRPGGKQDHYKNKFIEKSIELYPQNETPQDLVDIDYKILSKIFNLRALNQKANSNTIAEPTNSTPEIVFAHLKKMHDEQLVTFLTVDGFGPDTNFHLSPKAMTIIRHHLDSVEGLLFDT